MAQWGYPYVFVEWFFHMTLTRQPNAAIGVPPPRRSLPPPVRAPEGDGDLPIYTDGTGRSAYDYGTSDPIRLSAALRRAMPCVRELLFRIVSKTAADGMGTTRVRRSMIHMAIRTHGRQGAGPGYAWAQ
ncbi:MAG: DUF1045 domain-containing protein [Acetobacteraceae bacterium]|nr:DUF1045 domain-containing protein [Acetobacteraceae bacterium]